MLTEEQQYLGTSSDGGLNPCFVNEIVNGKDEDVRRNPFVVMRDGLEDYSAFLSIFNIPLR